MVRDLQALRRQPMTVYGDGKQTRSFQYVSDLVSINCLLVLFVWTVIISCNSSVRYEK
jgi:dTDP-D-glucose 4,6-dehydratase